MATIRKNGKNWQTIIRLKGHQPESRSFPRKADAKAWGETREAELRGGSVAIGGMTLGALLDEYEAQASATSHRRFLITFRNRCTFLDVPVAKLTRQHFIDYRTVVLRTNARYSYNKGMVPIPAALKYAMETKRWPQSHLEPILKEIRIKATQPKRRRRFFKEEQQRFLQAAQQHIKPRWDTKLTYPVFEALVILLVETSMRIGEVMKARKDQVRGNFLMLEQGQTKTKNPRTVALSPRALSSVEVLCAASATEKLSPIGYSGFATAFHAVVKAGTFSDLRVHDLRHEALSRLSESGLLGPSELMAMSGHNNLRQLGDYIHANPQTLVQKLQLLGQSDGTLHPTQTHLKHSDHPQHSNSDRPLLEAQPILAQAC
jgi:integrase